MTGGSAAEQRSYGDFLDHDARYERTSEFLSIVRGVWKGKGFDFSGKHYRVENGGLVQPLLNPPTIYFGGASAAAERVAAEHADVYLAWGETPPMLRERIRSVRAQAAAHQRSLRFGVRLHVITRDTSEEAWAEASRLLERIPPGAIEEAQQKFAATESVGQARQSWRETTRKWPDAASWSAGASGSRRSEITSVASANLGRFTNIIDLIGVRSRKCEPHPSCGTAQPKVLERPGSPTLRTVVGSRSRVASW